MCVHHILLDIFFLDFDGTSIFRRILYSELLWSLWESHTIYIYEGHNHNNNNIPTVLLFPFVNKMKTRIWPNSGSMPFEIINPLKIHFQFEYFKYSNSTSNVFERNKYINSPILTYFPVDPITRRIKTATKPTVPSFKCRKLHRLGAILVCVCVFFCCHSTHFFCSCTNFTLGHSFFTLIHKLVLELSWAEPIYYTNGQSFKSHVTQFSHANLGCDLKSVSNGLGVSSVWAHSFFHTLFSCGLFLCENQIKVQFD